MKVALDTSVLLLILSQSVPVSDEPERLAAQQLLTRRRKLWVPMVVLAEALYAIAEPARVAVVQRHEDGGALLAFDAVCARLTSAFGPPRATASTSRQAAKWDHAIAASAVRHRIGVLCALDDGFGTYFSRIESSVRVMTPSQLCAID